MGQVVLDKLAGVGFYLVEIELDQLGGDRSDDGQRFVGGFFPLDGGMVHHDFAVEAFEIDLLVRVVGYHSDKFTGGEVGDPAGRDCKIQLLALAYGLAGDAFAAAYQYVEVEFIPSKFQNMNFAEDKIESIKALLSQEFWSGKRWLSFNTSLHKIGIRDFKCFMDYQTASSYCDDNNRHGKIYSIKALAPVLKVLNKGLPSQISAAEIKDIQVALDLYPITFLQPIALVKMILYHEEYLPVIWNKPINPLTQIEYYHILEVKTEGRLSNKAKVLFSFKEIRKAFPTFNGMVKKPPSERNKLSIVLFGQFYDRKFDPNNFDLDDKNAGLLLYKAIPDPKAKHHPYYSIEQVHDPTSPIKTEQAMFVKYNPPLSQLDFYNGALKKILPGRMTEKIDGSHFYFGLLN